MKLIGSLASPYVRRIRILLHNQDYKFEPVNVFTSEGQGTISKYSPTLRIPILIDQDKVFWDSLLISEYLLEENISLETKKELVLINEMSDAGIQLFQLRKFKIDSNDQSVFSVNNLNRLKLVLEYFESKNNDRWDLTSQWLFCTLDWFSFRNVYNWRDNYPSLTNFYEKHKNRAEIRDTKP